MASKRRNRNRPDNLAPRRRFLPDGRLEQVIFKWVILAGVSFLVSVFVLEWALGLYESSQVSESRKHPEPYYSWSFNTSYGATIGREGVLDLAMHPFAVYANLPGQKTAYFTTDEQGFRGPPNSQDSQKAKTIVVVGGSTAFGTGLRSDEDTFVSRLEASLKDVNVINAAVIGHLSGQELSYVVSELVDLNPDLIVALDGYNDLIDQMTMWPRTAQTAGVNNTFFVMEQRMRQLYVLESGGLIRRIGSALPRIFKNTARLLDRGHQRLPGSDDPSSWSLVEPRTDRSAVGEAIAKHPIPLARIYSRNIDKMRTVAEAFGARLLCVLQPDQLSFPRGGKQDLLAEAYAVFRSEAKKSLREAGVEHIDLNDFTGVFEQTMFMDRMHLDARGNQAMAEVLRKTIQHRNLLSPDPRAKELQNRR